MKLTKRILITGLFAFGAFFIGCDHDSEDSVTVSGLSLSPSSVAQGIGAALSGTVEGDPSISSVVVTVENATGDDVTSDFTITQLGVGSDATSWDLKDDGSVTVTPKASTSGGTYKVVVTAAAGSETNIGKVTLTVTGDVGTALVDKTAGAFQHIDGACQGSYDLVNNVGVSSGAAKSASDMVNTDAAAAAFTGSWTVGTGNTTKYVKDNSFDYTGATEVSAKASYDAGSSSSTIASPAVGDIYVALLRDGKYAVVKIMEMSASTATCPDGTTPTDNTGKLSFNYKMEG